MSCKFSNDSRVKLLHFSSQESKKCKNIKSIEIITNHICITKFQGVVMLKRSIECYKRVIIYIELELFADLYICVIQLFVSSLLGKSYYIDPVLFCRKFTTHHTEIFISKLINTINRLPEYQVGNYMRFEEKVARRYYI